MTVRQLGCRSPLAIKPAAVLIAVTLALTCAWSGARPAKAATLDTARARHAVACGVVTEPPDWNKEDLHGDLSAFGTVICQAVALATLGRADAADIHRFAAEEDALRGLRASEVDVAIGVTPSATLAIQFDVAFGPVVFWDSQTFLVRRAAGIAEARDLAAKPVCFIDGTEQGSTLLAWMKASRIAMHPFPFQEEGEMSAGLAGGRCAAIGGYQSRLADLRAHMPAPASDYVLLPDTLAIAPAGAATRQGDPAWSSIVASTIDALIGAEMAGITRANLSHQRNGDDPAIRHLLGEDWSAGQSLRLDHDWSARVIARLGNYGEIFGRTVGENAPLGLKRGLNAVCVRGGALCAPPVR